MVDYKLIRDFLERYGSKITDLEGKKETFGVLSPGRYWEAERDEKIFFPAGYRMKCEYVLMSLNESGVIQKGKSIRLNRKVFHVIGADWYYYADKPLYLRAYLNEEVAYDPC